MEGGGCPRSNFRFSLFEVYVSSPEYLVFRMGSLLSQFATVAEIWPDKVGSYARFSWLNYRKITGKVHKFRVKNLSSFHEMVLEPYKLPWGILREISKNFVLGFLKFWFLGHFWAPEISTVSKNPIFWDLGSPKVAKNTLNPTWRGLFLESLTWGGGHNAPPPS